MILPIFLREIGSGGGGGGTGHTDQLESAAVKITFKDSDITVKSQQLRRALQ